MATVWLPEALRRDFLPGASVLEIDAPNVIQLVAALDAMSPGFGAFIEAKVAIAVDGVVWDHWATPLAAGSEVALVPRVAGGRPAR